MSDRPNGGVQKWNPKTPTTSLEDSPALKATDAMDDPECVPGKDSPFTPFARGSRKPSAPFGLATPGNNQT